MAASRQIEAN